MVSRYQLSERTRSDGVFPALKASYFALSKSGPAREELSGKLFCFCPYLFQIFRINNSFVLAAGFIQRVYGSGFGNSPATMCLRTSSPIVLLLHRLPFGVQNLL